MDTTKKLNRRETLTQLASLQTSPQPSRQTSYTSSEALLPLITRGIALCHELGQGGYDEITLAAQTLISYLHPLRSIVKDSSSQRKVAAHLLAEALLLLATLGIHREGILSSVHYAEQAFEYSIESEDIELQLIILKRLMWIYSCNRQYKQATSTASAALSILNNTRMPISARTRRSIWSGFAKFQARVGQQVKALQALELAYTYFITNDEASPIYSDYHWLSGALLDEGLTYYYLGQHEKALNAFAKIIPLGTVKPQLPISSERVRIEILNYQTLASLKLPNSRKDKALSICLWKSGIEHSKSLQSELRLTEAIRAYDIMEALWSNEQDVIELRDIATHW
ncbi:hypothetical protein [Tengunoibacter tsumagoiensis]|uniref:MalT-like TPR region domain-containing protein n=1 Tax=Tengunoibacter tsumagoiensis TaxID=2014871 RepID=A0A402A9W9_9CHLR|nr:hypothetical protein [Tengunoibacter tsumagoiensis]GCE15953.1 hypothetical protein KTT_58120 [Tengunoibacter tsumagoiensis]